MNASLVAVVSALLAGAATPAAADEPPLLRLIDGRDSDRIVRVNPRTLAPVSRPIETFRRGWSRDFSPDGRFLAYAGSARPARVQLIDVRRWRSVRVLTTGDIGTLTFARNDRLIEAGGTEIRVLSVPGGRLVARHPLDRFWVDSEAIPNGVALLTQPRRGLAPAGLLLADGDGGLRRIRLDRIESGGNRRAFLRPALAVDAAGGRAYVVAPRQPLVAEVDLASGAVTYHPLGASAAKGTEESWWRDAQWTAGGQLAITGEHMPRPLRSGLPAAGPLPYGLRLVNPRDWSTRMVNRRTNALYTAGDRLLATGTTWNAGWRKSTSTGLLGFDLGGRSAFGRFAGKDVAVLGDHGRYAHVWVRPDRMLHVIDLRSGRTVHTMPVGPARLPTLLTDG
ncbi:MAG: hypothetical protein QOE69_388 [Thermoleophilaceae bacterium]|jgi:hypothetical protein|nr:hypothetical protein [Thermoleophilaceae bacterium]